MTFDEPRLRIKNLPPTPLKVCAVCLAQRGNVRKGWEPVIDSTGQVRGYTCPGCPKVGEPIQRALSKTGAVRFRTILALPGGKQQWRTWDTLADARTHVAKVRADLADGLDVGTKAETVEALCDRWLKGKRRVRNVTSEGYYFALRPVVRRLGQRPASSLRLHDIRSLIDWLETQGGNKGKPLGPRGMQAALVAFAQVLDIAVAEKMLDSNLVRDKTVEKPSVATKAGFANLQWWEWDTVLTFRDTADTDPYAALWRLTLTGFTRADICGLRWSDIDLDAGTVTVSQGRVALLRALRARQAGQRLALGKAYDTSHDLVLVDAFGTPVRPAWYSARFWQLCEQAGVPRIHLHSCRHSLAKRMDDLGVPLAARAALLGHRVEMHLSTYLPSATAAGINDALDALGTGARGEQAPDSLDASLDGPLTKAPAGW